MRRCLQIGLVSLALALAWTTVPAAQTTPWVEDWLKEYASGKRVEVVERLKTAGNLAQLQSDLDRLLPDWIARKGADPVASRRAIAAFALEAAMTHVDQASAASKLIEWGCRQIRRDPKPDEFDRLWHLAAFAALEGAADADGIESHITHVKFQFPSEPRLALARGVAEELRVFEGMTRGRASASELARYGEEAVRRFQDAMADASTRGEAGLRQGHALLQLGKFEPALDVLGQVESATTDADFVYLTRLFRGRALDRLGRADDARRAYQAALEVRPAGATATVALSALLFRRGLRDEADAMIEGFLGRNDTQDDPWWSYWPGDYRLAGRLASCDAGGAEMTRATATCILAIGVASTGAFAQQQPPVFRTNIDVVTVDVSVRSGNGAVAGLTAADFEVLDNGVPQKIEAFSLETLAIDVTMLLDASKSVEGRVLDRLKTGVLTTAGLLGKNDALRLLALQHRIRQVFAFQPGGGRPPVEGLTAQGGTSLYDGLAAAMMHRSDPERRQLVIAYTDGQDTLSILDAETAREVALRADAVVHIVVPVEARKLTAPDSPNAKILRELAGQTGGQVFYPNASEGLTGAFTRALSEFRTSYVLRYTRNGVAAEGWHDISVRVTSGNYDVHAKKGYGGS